MKRVTASVRMITGQPRWLSRSQLEPVRRSPEAPGHFVGPRGTTGWLSAFRAQLAAAHAVEPGTRAVAVARGALHHDPWV